MKYLVLSTCGLLLFTGCDIKGEEEGGASGSQATDWLPISDGIEWEFDDGENLSAEIQASVTTTGWTLDARINDNDNFTTLAISGWTEHPVLYIDQIRINDGHDIQTWNADAPFPLLGNAISEGAEFEEDFTKLGAGWVEIQGKLTGLADLGTADDDGVMTVEYDIGDTRLSITLVRGVGPVMAVFKGDGEIVSVEEEE